TASRHPDSGRVSCHSATRSLTIRHSPGWLEISSSTLLIKKFLQSGYTYGEPASFLPYAFRSVAYHRGSIRLTKRHPVAEGNPWLREIQAGIKHLPLYEGKVSRPQRRAVGIGAVPSLRSIRKGIPR